MDIFSYTLSFKISALMSRLSPFVGRAIALCPKFHKRQLPPFLTLTLTLSTAQRGNGCMPSLLLLYFLPMSGLYKATPSSQDYKTLRSRHRQLCPSSASSEHPLALLAGFSMERRILRSACASSCYRCEQRQRQRGTLEASHPVLAVHWNSSLTSIPRLNPSQVWGCAPLILRQEVYKATPSYIENYI